jgi:hypothetical protein
MGNGRRETGDRRRETGDGRRETEDQDGVFSCDNESACVAVSPSVPFWPAAVDQLMGYTEYEVVDFVIFLPCRFPILNCGGNVTLSLFGPAAGPRKEVFG